jgi:hypothetical protein
VCVATETYILRKNQSKSHPTNAKHYSFPEIQHRSTVEQMLEPVSVLNISFMFYSTYLKVKNLCSCYDAGNVS